VKADGKVNMSAPETKKINNNNNIREISNFLDPKRYTKGV